MHCVDQMRSLRLQEAADTVTTGLCTVTETQLILIRNFQSSYRLLCTMSASCLHNSARCNILTSAQKVEAIPPCETLLSGGNYTESQPWRPQCNTSEDHSVTTTKTTASRPWRPQSHNPEYHSFTTLKTTALQPWRSHSRNSKDHSVRTLKTSHSEPWKPQRHNPKDYSVLTVKTTASQLWKPQRQKHDDY
jgi:hypothetical protein